MPTIKLDSKNFYTEVNCSEIPVLVDFYAGWCTPCRMLSPVLEDISDNLSGEVKVARVDVSAEDDLAEKFHILSVPTMMIFKNGKVTDTLVGAAGKQQIMELLRV